MKRNLELKAYKTASACAQDIRQVFENCFIANGKASVPGHKARKLQRLFEDRYRSSTPHKSL